MSLKVKICSKALVRCGCNEISSFDESSTEATVAENFYDEVKENLLSSHPWSFALGQTSLSRLTATPVADYDFAYQLPTDFLKAISLGSGNRELGAGVDYRLFEDRVHTNCDSIILTYVFSAPEEIFPPFFTTALITMLAAELCLPLTENTSRTDLLFRLAERRFTDAKRIDSQQKPPVALVSNALISVRG